MRLPLRLICFLPSLLQAQPPNELVPAGALCEVVPALFGKTVLPYDQQDASELKTALKKALALINAQGIEADRVNEVGNVVENHVLAALLAAGFEAHRPIARSGKQRSAGYPDLEAHFGGEAFYFEIKTYHPETEHSTQRTFYLSPSEDPKVTHAAFHLLIAFAMEPTGEKKRYRAKSVKLVDLHNLPVKRKIEYNASNQELYGREEATVLELCPEEIAIEPESAQNR